LAIHPQNPNIMLAGNWGYILKTEDGGNSWREINIPVYMSDIEFDPIDLSLVYGSAYSGQVGKSVFKSTDLGENWINISNDLDSAAGAENIDIDHFCPNTIYLARTGYSGPGHSAAKSTDGGQHWLNITPPQMQREIAFCIIASKITANTVYLTTLGDGVFRSRDGGSNWTPINTGLNVSMTSQIVEDSITGILYLGTYFDGIYKSSDNGDHWIKISQNIKNAECIELVANTRNSDSLFVVTGSGLYGSIDGARSWQRIGLTPPCFYGLTGCIAMDKYNPQNIYVGYSTYNGQGIGGIIRSSDGGLSWNYHTNGLPENCMPQKIRLAYSDNLLYRVYLADQYDLYYSEDNGENWITVDGNLPSGTSFNQLTVSEINPDLIFVFCNLLGKYFRSTDGGLSWDSLTNMPLGDSRQEIVCDPIDPNLIYANCGVGQGLYRSPDRGQTWNENNGNLPRYNNYFAVSGFTINPLNPLNMYINSYHRGFFISQDGGIHWNSFRLMTKGCFSDALCFFMIFAGDFAILRLDF